MPDSKSRSHHKNATHQKTSITHPKTKSTSRASTVVALFFALLGLGITYFIYGANGIALVIGTIIGAVIGSVFGYLIARNLSKK